MTSAAICCRGFPKADGRLDFLRLLYFQHFKIHKNWNSAINKILIVTR